MTDATARSPSAPLALPREHLPRGEDFLMWPPCLQSHGYRNVDRLFATRAFRCSPEPRELPRAAEIDPAIEVDGRARSVAEYMDRHYVAGLLVLKHGHIVLERYGLGLRAPDRWSTMSTVKSMTALLAGAAVQDGHIESLDTEVQHLLPRMAGSAYDGVSIRHLLTMSSGVRWSEDYGDRHSDVNRYSKSLADRVPGGVLAQLQALPRAHAPGSVWAYNTGDTYLLGALIAAATGSTLAAYMERTIWQPAGMEFDGYYTLESAEGQEIGGSRAGMALRDIARIAQVVLDDGVIAGRRRLPEGWIAECARPAFVLDGPRTSPQRRALGVTGYGLSWWLRDDGTLLALGHAGQRILIDRGAGLALVQLAVYPEPRYASPAESDHDAELASMWSAVRAATGAW